MSTLIRAHIRQNVVGYLALFLALNLGTAWALERDSIRSKHIKDGDVAGVDLAANAVTADKVADGTVGNAELAGSAVDSGKVAFNSLTADDIANTSSLSGLEINEVAVPLGGDLSGSLASARIDDNTIGTSEVAGNSLTGLDINESTLTIADMGCQPGTIQGYALIKGGAGMPTTSTTSSAWVEDTYNCSGYPVKVAREGTGYYSVFFPGTPFTLSLATVAAQGAPSCDDNFVASQAGGAEAIRVQSYDDDGDPQHCWVMVAVI